MGLDAQTIAALDEPIVVDLNFPSLGRLFTLSLDTVRLRRMANPVAVDAFVSECFLQCSNCKFVPDRDTIGRWITDPGGAPAACPRCAGTACIVALDFRRQVGQTVRESDGAAFIRQLDSQLVKARSAQLANEGVIQSAQAVVASHLPLVLYQANACLSLGAHPGYSPGVFKLPQAERTLQVICTTIPWSASHARDRLRYVGKFPQIVRDNWTAPGTFMMHLLYCLAGGVQLHMALTRYASTADALREFTVYPVDLLSLSERREVGLA